MSVVRVSAVDDALAVARRAVSALAAGVTASASKSTMVELLEFYEELRGAFIRLDTHLSAGGQPPMDWRVPPEKEADRTDSADDCADAINDLHLRGRLLSEARTQLFADLVGALRQRVSIVDWTSGFDSFLGVSGTDQGRALAAELLRAAETLLPAPSGDSVVVKAPLVDPLRGRVEAMGFSDGYQRRSGGRTSTDVCWLDVAPSVTGKDYNQTVRIHVDRVEGDKFKVGQRVEIRLVTVPR